ncbi:hypothetical protein ACWEQU_05785 [Streptomyces nodosus]
MAISKIKITKAVGALIKAGMSPATARNAVKLLDFSEAIGPQIADLVEEDPELFGLDADGNELPDDDQDTDDTPMTAAEAKAARLRGGHRLRTAPGEGQTSAQRLASALTHDERPRQSAAPATAQKAADVLTRGVGRSADR